MSVPAPSFTPSAPSRFVRVREWYRFGRLLPWLVLAAALFATYQMWQNERQNAMKDQQIDFDFRVREASSNIAQRMHAYEQILRGARGLFAASGNVAHETFLTYLDSLHLAANYPGTRGIGYAVVVPGMHDGAAAVHTLVTHLEPPLNGTPDSIGQDMFADPVRRAAMELARDRGHVAISGRVLLPLDASEDARIQPGFLMYLPVYRGGAAHETLEQRRANIRGWVYAPFRMIDLMSGILGEEASEVDIEIHDGVDMTDATMMYDPDVSGSGGNPNALFKSVSNIEVAGRIWAISIRSLYGFESRLDRKKPQFVAYAGIGASVLLALLTWLLVYGRARALQAAQEIDCELAERKRAEEGLRLAATVLKTVEEAVLVTDADNNIISVNPAFTTISGYAPGDVIGKNPRIFASGKHSREFYKEMWDTLLTTGTWHGEIWDKRKSGEPYVKWLSIKLVRAESGQLTHYVAVFSDISERKAAEERMQYMAHHDLLTGLPNRLLLAVHLQQALAQARRDKTHLALMFIDLDKFKPINDNLGHEVGDMLLKEVAKRLELCVRESDTVARVGGDEFVVLLTIIEEEPDVVVVAGKILHALGLTFELAGHSLHISASIGIAVYPEHGEDEKMLTRNADIAMYYAKGDGRNNAKIYAQQEMREISNPDGGVCEL
ncbi:MAG: diguanylate cyclase [Nitrosomonadales bacterium]|nr:diguanylate cyclase [Nitrosomonadales bacterium]